MEEKKRRRRTKIEAENVEIGERSSLLSSIIFFLLCLVPVFSTILFGGVDNGTWIAILIFWAAILILWLGEAWKGGGLLVNPTTLQIPLIGLLVIGIVQLLPL